MDSESLRGKLLLASPSLMDPNFRRTVVLIAEHNEQGAMGLILNRPAEVTVQRILPDLVWVARPDALVFVGGPVAPTSAIVLAQFSDPGHGGMMICDEVGFLPAEVGDHERVAAATVRARVFAGHAGWGAGQLESELAEAAWIVEAPERDEIFTDDPSGLWSAVLRRKGRDYALIATMPPDPSLN